MSTREPTAPPEAAGDEPCNVSVPANFSGEHLRAEWVRNVQNLALPAHEPTVVVNVSPERAVLAGSRNGAGPRQSWLLPWRSVLLEDTVVVSAPSLVLLRVVKRRDLGGVIQTDRWAHTSQALIDGKVAYPTFPKATPLWRSSKQTLDHVQLDPVAFATQGGRNGDPRTFRLTVNLWFAPAHTNCLIHNQHDFLEVHTQVYGVGRMQKFHSADETTRYEDVILAAGTTHDPFMEITADGTFIYPWHRYYSDTDCVWMATELHPVPVA